MTTSPPSGGRRRPRRRWPKFLLGIVAAVLVVSIAGGGFWVYRFGVPPESDMLGPMNRLAEENAGGMDVESPSNALHHYRAIVFDDLGLAAAEEYNQPADSGNHRFAIWRRWDEDDVFGELLWGDGSAFARPEIVAELGELRPVLESLDRAADAHAFRARYTASGDIFTASAEDEGVAPGSVMAPQIAMFRRLGRLNAVRLRAAAIDDDWTGLIRSGRTGLRHARHISTEPFLLAGIVGMLCEDATLQEVSFAALEHDLPREVCETLVDELDEAGPLSLEHAFRGELIWLPPVFAYMITNRWDDGPAWTMEFWQTRFDQPSPRAAVRDGSRYLESVASITATPRRKRPADALPSPGAATDLVGAYDRVLRQGDQIRSRRTATRIILLLERHHALTGEWPAALEDIMPREDTLDPNTLTPFVYTLTPDGPFPFSLLAPPEADFIREEDRDFTKPREPLTPTTPQR